MAIDFFRSLLGSSNIDLRCLDRMKWIPLEDPKGYLPFLSNLLKGSSEGVVNNEVVSEAGSTHSLEEF
jgi:hypothetical protein